MRGKRQRGIEAKGSESFYGARCVVTKLDLCNLDKLQEKEFIMEYVTIGFRMG